MTRTAHRPCPATTATPAGPSPSTARASTRSEGWLRISIGAVCAWWTTRSIMAPLDDAIELSKRMASGDLSEPFEAQGHGELLELQQSLQETSERIFQIVSKVRSGTTAVG